MSSLTALLLLCQAATSNSRESALRHTWEAMCYVESRNNPRAVNKTENAVGIGQIRPIMVAECNRLQKARTFTLAQRFDPLLSYEMFRVHSLHYWPHGGPEQWSRGWNGGPTGPRKAATLGYWAKIKARMGD